MKKLAVLLCLALCLATFTGCADTPEEPPRLAVTCGEETVTTGSGSYSWDYAALFGEHGVEACGIHPLDGKEHTKHLETESATATLQFSLKPQSLYAEYWSDTEWGNTEAPSKMAMVSNGTLSLQGGGAVYQIHASWEGRNYNGSASYVVWITTTSEEALLAEPPTLTVQLGEESFSVENGTASWLCTADNGTAAAIEADADHPLLMVKKEDRIDTKEALAGLSFPVAPDRMEAVFWPDTQLGSTENLHNTDPGMRGNQVNLYKGGYIYAIHAYWESHEEYQGDAQYCFYIRRK